MVQPHVSYEIIWIWLRIGHVTTGWSPKK